MNGTTGHISLQGSKAGLDVNYLGSANLVKTTTGTTNLTDFSYTGSTLTNVTSANNSITMDDGAFTTVYSTASATTAGATNPGAGSHSIVREDGTVIIIHGNTSALGSRWDGSGASMTSVTVSASNIGAGAISLKRPDGRYLIINGGGTLGVTSLYDPWGITANAGGPAVCGSAAITTGTNAFQRGDGKYVILCGNQTAWGVYDPSTNVYTGGTAVASAFGAGAHALMRDDGTFLVFRGGGTTDHWIYNPFNTIASNVVVGSMGTINPITSNAPSITTGAFSIRRNDGKYLVVPGAQNTSYIYDPTSVSGVNSGAGSMTAQTVAAGYGPTAALLDGAQALWRQDGKYTVIIGSGSTVTNTIDPSQTGASQFVDYKYNLPAAIGAGVHLAPRPDGKYQIIRGGSSSSTDTMDFGFVVGGNGSGSQLASYETDCMTANSLNSTSTLKWNTNAEGTMNFQVKTGNNSCSGSYQDVAQNGGDINPAAGDNRVQVKAFFKRPFPMLMDQEWGLWRGLSQTKYRRASQDPTLYDLTIDNSTELHRTKFDLGIGTSASSTDPSGPMSVNVNVAADNSLQLAAGSGNQILAAGNQGAGDTYNGAFGTHIVLPQTASEGTIVMKRPNGTFMVIEGHLTVANAAIYDPVSQTFTANANGVFGSTCAGIQCTPNNGAAGVPVGKGALAVKRPDGKFLIVNGFNNVTANALTSIYDPVASTFTTGPSLIANSGRGSLAIPLANGKIVIMHGNFTGSSSIYDPVQNVMIAGPSLPGASNNLMGLGAMAIPRPDGQYLVIPGLQTDIGTCTALNTQTYIFDTYAGAYTTTNAPALVNGVGAGAFAFQRSDGNWVIMKGGATITTCAPLASTMIYNPLSNSIQAGAVPAAGNQQGGTALQRPDGNWLIINGNNTTVTAIYEEKAGATTGAGAPIGAFVAGPALLTAPGGGSVTFQRDDGKYVIITGRNGDTNNTVGTPVTTVQQYDASWVTNGMYRSEQLSVSDLDSNSTLSWKATPFAGISAQVKTASSRDALATNTGRDVPYSGALISPASGETWLQLQFNFKRTFPGNSGIWTDVWSGNSGSNTTYNFRQILNPTLNSFWVNKDTNLFSIANNGISLFRISSNGDVYTSPTTNINSGGADLAERYTSADELAPGEVVAIDPSTDHSVKRAMYAYEKDVLGVVSTQPGFVAGSYTDNSYPIALVGRVPVKVSTENGNIAFGNFLTSSSIPGVAMRATMGGRAIGTALESPDMSTFTACPGDSDSATRRCGTVMMFVNLIDYQGMPITVLMNEDAATRDMTDGGLSVTTDSLASDSGMVGSYESGVFSDSSISEQAKILSYLSVLSGKRRAASMIPSETVADRVIAVNDVITQTVFANLIVANTIRANQIEGLSVLTNNLITNALSSMVQSQSTASGMLVSQGSVLGVSGLAVGADLTASGSSTFVGSSIFQALVTFLNNIIIKGNALFEGHVTFNSDTAGIAVIASSTTTVDVLFDKPYETPPVVTISLSLKEATDSAFMTEGVQAAVAGVNEKGFTIVLSEPVPRDLEYNWVAIAVKDKRRTVGKGIGVPSASPTITPTPTTSTTPSLTPTPGLTITPTESVTPIPTLTPTPSETPTLAPPTPTPSPGPAPPTGQTVTVLSNSLGYVNVRDTSASTGNILGQIPVGETVSYDTVQYGWYKVTYNGIVGWVSGTYVQVN
jgi:hypothetical protein